ncbi:MAG: hypothetical protein ACREOS_02720 [Candidatus Dormibacteraceae bacterium]
MSQLLYAVQFRGRATGDDRGKGVVRTTAFAPSCTVTTLIGSKGIYGAIEPAPGERATFESEVIAEGAIRPRGTATVSYGMTGHCLCLTLLGALDLDNGPLMAAQSALIWKVERGEGQFAGARGLITSNLIRGDAGEVTDNQLGVIFLAPPGGDE